MAKRIPVNTPRHRPPPPWKPTQTASKLMGVSRWTFSNLRKDGTLKQGYHWKVKNPTAAHLTYLWHVSRVARNIRQWRPGAFVQLPFLRPLRKQWPHKTHPCFHVFRDAHRWEVSNVSFIVIGP
jgi:hypothetical protein